jgi:hypothetical protein
VLYRKAFGFEFMLVFKFLSLELFDPFYEHVFIDDDRKLITRDFDKRTTHIKSFF